MARACETRTLDSSLRSKSGSELETLGYCLLRLCADETVDEFAVFEDEHRWDARDLKT